MVAAAPFTGPPPQIDGQLLEAVWAMAPPIAGFTQRDPIEGAPASEPTELRILFDHEAVYVGARMWDSRPDIVVAHVTRRDQFSQSDWIIISFDNYRDRRTAYEFALNPAGVQRDRHRFRDAESHDAIDLSWDAVWDGAASRDSLGWTAEFRIPYSQLRFATGSELVWGFRSIGSSSAGMRTLTS
ncbi:MAG: carbohydrate binding family 9 domain-containing protein, partial [Gemmatimonadetes bacterium]|nr:carbohydrate binding family 9 domain-containing protein [Gemmatimonadota bacterium]